MNHDISNSEGGPRNADDDDDDDDDDMTHGNKKQSHVYVYSHLVQCVLLFFCSFLHVCVLFACFLRLLFACACACCMCVCVGV